MVLTGVHAVRFRTYLFVFACICTFTEMHVPDSHRAVVLRIDSAESVVAACGWAGEILRASHSHVLGDG